MIEYRHHITAAMLPNSKAAFRPKADHSFHLLVAENAQVHWHNTHIDAELQKQVAEIIRAEIVKRFPPHHMAILQMYGQTREQKQVQVSLSSGSVYLDIETPILLPENPFRGWSTVLHMQPPYPHHAGNDFNIKPACWERDAVFAQSCVDGHIKSKAEFDAHRVPESTVVFFRAIDELRAMHKFLQDCWRGFPFSFKTGEGHYPTWGEIRAAFPVVDGYMASLEVAPAQAMQEAA